MPYKRQILYIGSFVLYILVIIYAVTFLSAVFPPTPANAHSWYDPWCCNEQDCAPALEVKPLDDGEFWVRTPAGSGTTNDMTRKLESQDEKFHACLVPMDRSSFYVRCLYVPPAS